MTTAAHLPRIAHSERFAPACRKSDGGEGGHRLNAGFEPNDLATADVDITKADTAGVDTTRANINGVVTRKTEEQQAERCENLVDLLSRERVSVTWKTWRARFVGRALRSEQQLIRSPQLSEQCRQQLARSLAIFQLGEGGEGRIAKEIEHARLTGIDDHYRVALKLFVREEGRHARLLGRCITALGGSSANRHWSSGLFTRVRRMFGIRFKLLVLLAAEIISLCSYRRMAAALPDSDVRLVLLQLCSDEQLHLRFHGDFFRSEARTKLARGLVGSLLLAIVIPAIVMVAWDHRRCWRALDIRPLSLVADALRSWRFTLRWIGQPGPRGGLVPLPAR